jgi:hypothetical protein
MPFLPGRCPSQVELISDDWESPLAQSLAKALVWLAGYDMLYTDLRAANVLVYGEGALEQVYLIDYDDMRVVPGLGDSLRKEGARAAFSRAFAESREIGGQRYTGEVDFSSGIIYPGVWRAVETLSPQPEAGEPADKKRRLVEPPCS